MLSAHLEPHGKRLRRCVVMNLPGWRTYIPRAASNLLQTVYKTTGSGERIKYGGFILFLCCRHIKIDVMQRMSCFSVSHQLINNNKLFITIFYFSSSNHVHKMYILLQRTKCMVRYSPCSGRMRLFVRLPVWLRWRDWRRVCSMPRSLVVEWRLSG